MQFHFSCQIKLKPSSLQCFPTSWPVEWDWQSQMKNRVAQNCCCCNISINQHKLKTSAVLSRKFTVLWLVGKTPPAKLLADQTWQMNCLDLTCYQQPAVVVGLNPLVNWPDTPARQFTIYNLQSNWHTRALTTFGIVFIVRSCVLSLVLFCPHFFSAWNWQLVSKSTTMSSLSTLLDREILAKTEQSSLLSDSTLFHNWVYK